MADENCCTNDVGYGTKVLKNGFRRIVVCTELMIMDDGSWGCGGLKQQECYSFSCERKLRAGW
jgi:hypothetical protein